MARTGGVSIPSTPGTRTVTMTGRCAS